MSQDRIVVLGAELERAVEDDDAEAVIEVGERLLRILPPGDPRRAIPLYYAGLACTVRFEAPGGGAEADRERAIACLREARCLLPRDHSLRPQVNLLAGLALSHRLLPGTDDGLHHLPEAIAALDEALDTVGEDQPVRFLMRYRLAMLLAIRYLMYGGTDEDRVRGLAGLTALAADPAVGTDIADVCRLMAAQLELLAGVPAELRSGEVTADKVERLQWRLSPPRPEAAGETLRLLEAVSARTMERLGTPGMLPLLKAITSLGKALPGKKTLPARELDDAIALIGEAAALEEPGTTEAAVATALGSLLRRERARRAGEDSADQEEGFEQVGELLASLGEHPLRPMLEALHTAVTAEDRLPERPDDLTALAGGLERLLTQMPEDHPARTRTLLRLTSTLVFQAGVTQSAGQLDRVRALLRDAQCRGILDEGGLPIGSFLLSWVDGVQGSLEADADRLNSAIERMRQATDLVPEGHDLRSMADVAIGSLLAQRYHATGNLEDIEAVSCYAARLPPDVHADHQWIPRQLGAMGEFLRHRHAPTPELIDDLIGKLEEADRLVPDEQRRWTGGARLPALLRMLKSAFTDEGGAFPTSGEELAEFRAAAETIANADPALLDWSGEEGMALVGAAFAARDRRQLDRGITLLARRAGNPSLAAFERLRVLTALGGALRMRHLLTRSRRDLDNAVSRLEEARLLALREPALPDTAVIFNALGDAYFTRGDSHRRDRRRAVTAGLDGLRLRTQEVLLQSGAGRGLAAARSAEGEAAQVARWCLAADEDEAAVRALELGRAIVLHSATVDAGIPLLLRDNGHHDLAREWEDETRESPWEVVGGDPLPLGSAGLRVPSDLRRRVLLALEHTEAERHLLLPPDPAEIATALRRAHAAALVYLLPRDDHGDGLAVLVRADGTIRHLPLPGLAVERGGPVERFERAQRDVQAGDGAWPGWEAAAGELASWAWETAMGPVLAKTTGRPGRPPRLVLVPVGRLGVVPWHAACRPVPGGVRYACQDAILCYASSARQFLDARRRETRPWPQNPALIEVTDSDLVWAAEEMEEIRRHYYPGCVHLGSDADEVITPERVLALLPGVGGPGASVLHVGCHAWRTDPPVDSYLVLGGEAKLPVRDILRQARARPAGAAGGLVVLATCVSDLTQDAHDEALTLATAFLAAGAAGVLGARWPVRDAPTGLFMIMFHHYLNSGYPDPAVALRATQLWMLNPRRRLPPGVGGLLADELGAHPLDAPANWAAFTYQGQ